MGLGTLLRREEKEGSRVHNRRASNFKNEIFLERLFKQDRGKTRNVRQAAKVNVSLVTH